MACLQYTFGFVGVSYRDVVENHLYVFGDILDPRWTRIIPDRFLPGAGLDALGSQDTALLSLMGSSVWNHWAWTLPDEVGAMASRSRWVS
jgi:hypothetical protein